MRVNKTISSLICNKKSRKRRKFVVNLKKQTQFSKGQIGAKSVMIMVYGDYGGRGWRKNKANSKPIKPNVYLTAENAEYAEQKGICVNGCSIKKYDLHLTSPRS